MEDFKTDEINYSRKWKKYDDFIKENIKRIKEINKYIYKTGAIHQNKFYSITMFEEIFWKIWLISEDEFYLEKDNEEILLSIISFTYLIDLKIKMYFIEVIENQESRLSNWHFALSEKIISLYNGDQKIQLEKKLNHRDKFNASGRRFHSIDDLIENKNIGKKIDINIFKGSSLYIESEEFVNEFKEFLSFRNKISHSENRIYHLIFSEENNDSIEEKNFGLAKKYIFENLILRDEDYIEINITYNKILKNIENSSLSKNTKEKLKNDIKNYINIMITLLGINSNKTLNEKNSN